MTSGAALHCLFLIEMVAWFLDWTILGLAVVGTNSIGFWWWQHPMLLGPPRPQDPTLLEEKKSINPTLLRVAGPNSSGSAGWQDPTLLGPSDCRTQLKLFNHAKLL